MFIGAAALVPSLILVYFQGSRFSLSRHGMNDEFCRQLSRETKHAVFDFSYRMAPEHSFPAALNNVEDAVNSGIALPEEFNLTRL
jgi:acetyl esterase/lipase